MIQRETIYVNILSFNCIHYLGPSTENFTCHMRTTVTQISLYSLISACAVHCPDSIPHLHSIFKIIKTIVVPVAEWPDLSQTWLKMSLAVFSSDTFFFFFRKCD